MSSDVLKVDSLPNRQFVTLQLSAPMQWICRTHRKGPTHHLSNPFNFMFCISLICMLSSVLHLTPTLVKTTFINPLEIFTFPNNLLSLSLSLPLTFDPVKHHCNHTNSQTFFPFGDCPLLTIIIYGIFGTNEKLQLNLKASKHSLALSLALSLSLSLSLCLSVSVSLSLTHSLSHTTVIMQHTTFDTNLIDSVAFIQIHHLQKKVKQIKIKKEEEKKRKDFFSLEKSNPGQLIDW